MQDGVWGVIDQRGRQIVAPKYTYIDEFVGPSAIYEQDYLLGLLHVDGHELTAAEYEAIEYFQVAGDELERIETHARVLKNERWGMIDLATGQLVIPCEWDYINYFGGGRVFVNTGGREVMRQGFMEYDGGKWGLFNADGQEITAPKFEYPEPFLGSSATVTYEGFEGLLGKDGQWVMEPKYSQFKTLDIKGQATQYLSVRKGDDWGWVDRAGKQLVKPAYSDVIWESGRTGRVLAKRDGRWGVVSFSGEPMVPFEYDHMTGYDHKGRLLVGAGGKFGLLDSRGATLHKLEAGSYVDVNGHWVLFDSAYTDFSTPGHGLIAAQTETGKWALLSTEPVKVLSDPVFDYAEPVFEGHFKTMKAGKWAITNASGENTFNHQLNDIQTLNDKWGAGMKGGDWFFIGPDGGLQDAQTYGQLRAMDSHR
ncbi:MAG: WG repeat-containing protein, partial [Bacteroidota bacterium]